nr:reverse transcriptase domain-containing protein [Tanacetum cinerariifolium]
MSENVRVCVCKVVSENCTLWGVCKVVSENCTLWGVRVPLFIGVELDVVENELSELDIEPLESDGNAKESIKEIEIASEKHHHKREYSQRTKAVSGSAGGHWKSKPKKQKSSMEDDLSQPWVCKETDPFTLRIRYIDFPKTRMPVHIKTYDGSEDPENRLKIFHSAAKTKRWAMLTWCHMFNFTLTENARGEMAASNREWKNSFPSWKQETGQKKNFKRGNFRNEQRMERKQDRFTLLTKTPREILALDKGKFKPPSPMTTPVKKGMPASSVSFMGRKAGGKEDSSNFIHSTRNDKIPSGRGDSHIAEQQDHSARMLNGFRTEKVHYHSWLSNPIMVKKHDDSWRMCVDFKDLNKACPKDGYPLPEIDWKVESLCGYPYKCLLDAYKGYHQIKMAEEDEEKTAFITSQGILCYSKMPFGLKNAGATYQRLVDKDFQKQIGRNLEVYVDDLVIKIQTKKEVIRDAEEMFKTLRKINMKLNPKKCAFGMREGTLLGYKVDADGLRVSPDKVKAIIDLPSPKCLKDVQKLNGKLASLNRFLSKSAEKSLPFFKTLKKCTKKSDFQWTPETEEAFKEIKQSIAELPMLMAPNEKEELIIYLAAAKEAICAVLMTGRDGKQVPIYFVSRALQGPKINYTPMEKLILALRFELGEHDIQYRPRTSVKGQILADFIVERPEDGTPDTPIEEREELPDPWILFTDGSSCMDGSGASLIIVNPEGKEFTYALRFRFNATNNEAEYEALIAGLWIASQMGIQNLQANVDSKLPDALSKIASTSFAHLRKQMLVEELREKAIDEKEILVVVEEGHTWMTPVYEYLTEGVLPEEKKKARTVRRKAGRYVVINEVLYKKLSLAHGCGVLDPSKQTMS